MIVVSVHYGPLSEPVETETAIMEFTERGIAGDDLVVIAGLGVR